MAASSKNPKTNLSRLLQFDITSLTIDVISLKTFKLDFWANVFIIG